jgi:hypothetical protein
MTGVHRTTPATLGLTLLSACSGPPLRTPPVPSTALRAQPSAAVTLDAAGVVPAARDASAVLAAAPVDARTTASGDAALQAGAVDDDDDAADPVPCPPLDEHDRVDFVRVEANVYYVHRSDEPRAVPPDVSQTRLGSVRYIDLNSDRRRDVFFRSQDCGDDGACNDALYLGCPDGTFAEILPMNYRADLRMAASGTVVDGVRWRDVWEVSSDHDPDRPACRLDVHTLLRFDGQGYANASPPREQVRRRCR